MQRVAGGECLNLFDWLSHECTTIFFVGIAPMFVGEVSLNAAMPFPKPIQSKIKYRPHFLTSGEMPDISRVRFKHSSIVAHAAECPLLG
jgi:hypothetical protein